MRKKTSRKIHKESAGRRAAHMGMLAGMGLKALLMFVLLLGIGIAAVWSVNPTYGKALLAAMTLAPMVGLATATARQNKTYETGFINSAPIIAADIIYEGSAVGENGTGYARPLVAGDRFLGFAEISRDNAAGSAGDKPDVRMYSKGLANIALSGAVITDVGASVYASDDTTFSFIGTSNTYVGTVYRWKSSGIVVLEFDASKVDPLGEGRIHETLSDNKTFDAQDVSKVFWVDTDAKVMTLPATAAGLGPITLVNAGAFGTVIITLDPNVNDKIMGPNLAGVDDKDLINTKATANRGDRVTVTGDGALGWYVSELKGTWAAE